MVYLGWHGSAPWLCQGALPWHPGYTMGTCSMSRHATWCTRGTARAVPRVVGLSPARPGRPVARRAAGSAGWPAESGRRQPAGQPAARPIQGVIGYSQGTWFSIQTWSQGQQPWLQDPMLGSWSQLLARVSPLVVQGEHDVPGRPGTSRDVDLRSRDQI